MQPIEFHGSVEIKKPPSMTDEECFSVWAAIHTDPTGNVTGFTTCWKPSYEDLQAMNKGGGVYIHSLSQRLVPMAVFTLDENGVGNDAG